MQQFLTNAQLLNPSDIDSLILTGDYVDFSRKILTLKYSITSNIALKIRSKPAANSGRK